MTTPTAPISLLDIQNEFGGAAPISLSEYYRGGGGGYVPAAQGNGGYGIIPAGSFGTTIDIGPFRNQTKAFIFNLVVAVDRPFGGINVRSEALLAGWDGSTILLATITVNPGVTVTGTLAGAAFTTQVGAYPVGSTITLINNGRLAGRGGVGGQGGSVLDPYTVTNGGNGGVGGIGVNVGTAVTIVNNGVIAAGGGGGGGGAASTYVFTNKDLSVTAYGASGSGGGGGAGSGQGGFAGTLAGVPLTGGAVFPGSLGSNGTTTVGGAGGPESGAGPFGPDGGAGGNGGAPGASGTIGGTGGADEHTYRSSPGAAGIASWAVVGNGFITWAPLGTIIGATT